MDENKGMAWGEFVQLPIEEQVEKINDLLKNDPKEKLEVIAKNNFNISQSSISKHFNKLGYYKQGGVYVLKENKNVTGEINSIMKKEKVSKSNKNINLEMYSHANEILTSIEDEELEAVTLKLPPSLHNELKTFLKQHKILKKQDVMAVALADFLAKYNQ